MGFNSCDKEVRLKVLNGKAELKPGTNPWDWLGDEKAVKGLKKELI
jgi:hypothetical protein